MNDLDAVLLQAIDNLGGCDYGVPIYHEAVRLRGSDFGLVAMYFALDDLVEKHYLQSYYGEATKERGGRRKKYYRRLYAI